jgi:hypothetical protein
LMCCCVNRLMCWCVDVLMCWWMYWVGKGTRNLNGKLTSQYDAPKCPKKFRNTLSHHFKATLLNEWNNIRTFSLFVTKYHTNNCFLPFGIWESVLLTGCCATCWSWCGGLDVLAVMYWSWCVQWSWCIGHGKMVLMCCWSWCVGLGVLVLRWSWCVGLVFWSRCLGLLAVWVWCDGRCFSVLVLVSMLRPWDFDMDVLVLMFWSWCFGLDMLFLKCWSWCVGLDVLVLMCWSWCVGLDVLVSMCWSWCVDLDVLVLLFWSWCVVWCFGFDVLVLCFGLDV